MNEEKMTTKSYIDEKVAEFWHSTPETEDGPDFKTRLLAFAQDIYSKGREDGAGWEKRDWLMAIGHLSSANRNSVLKTKASLEAVTLQSHE